MKTVFIALPMRDRWREEIEKDFDVSIDSDDIGRSSVNYIRKQSRVRGGSII